LEFFAQCNAQPGEARKYPFIKASIRFQKLNPDVPEYYKLRAFYYANANIKDLEIENYEKALELEPYNTTDRLCLVSELLNMNDYERAVRHLQIGENYRFLH